MAIAVLAVAECVARFNGEFSEVTLLHELGVVLVPSPRCSFASVYMYVHV